MQDNNTSKDREEDRKSRKDSSKKRRRKHEQESPSSSSTSSSKRKSNKKGKNYLHFKSTSYSNSSSNNRTPNPVFGDDLLRAERLEVEQKEEREWKEKLNHLASEDFIGSEFGGRGLQDNDVDDLVWEEEMQKHFSKKDKEKERERDFDETVPKRWRNGQVPIRLEEMDEEEYAEAIREGMWKRTHGKEIEEMEKLQKAQEKAKAKEAKGKAERRASKKRKREDVLKKAEKELLIKSREEFHKKWKELRETSSSSKSSLFFSDLPWPTLPATSIQPLSLSKSSIEGFIFSHRDDEEEGMELFRLILRLYHPDRFTSPSNWWKRIELGGEKNVQTIKEASKRISQSLAEIGRQRKDIGKEKSKE